MLGLLGALGGALISGLFGSEGQESANQTNIQLGREQMAFQERMSNTAYPRAVQGMKDAGLNPMLAYSQGGASAPMGAMPQVANVNAAGVSSAAQGMSAFSAIQQMLQSKAQTDQIMAATEQIKSNTFPQSVNAAIREAQRRVAEARGDVETESITPDIYERLAKSSSAQSAAHIARETIQAKIDEARAHGTREKDSFEADVRRRKAEARLTELGINEAEAGSKFYEHIGQGSPYLKMLIDFMRVFRGGTNRIGR